MSDEFDPKVYSYLVTVRVRVGADGHGVVLPTACSCDGSDCANVKDFVTFLETRGFEVMEVLEVERDTWHQVRTGMTERDSKLLTWVDIMFKHACVGARLQSTMGSIAAILEVADAPRQQPSDDPDNFKI